MERTVHLEMHSTGWVDLLATFWCKHFHTSVMWPIHGEYECRSCGRRHAVPWDSRKAAAQDGSPKHDAVLGILAAE